MYNFPTELQELQETVGCTIIFTIFLEEQNGPFSNVFFLLVYTF